MSTAIVHKKGKTPITVNPDMPDYNKTPFAKKKAEKARGLISKYGLPTKPKKGK